MPVPSLSEPLAIVLLAGAALAQSGWQQRTLLTPRPPARSHHALAYDAANARVVLFGGWGFQGVYRGDTWLWDGLSWTQANPPLAPPARLGHVMAYDSVRSRIVVHGGAIGGGNGTDSDDTWEWNGTVWSQVPSVVRPPGRRGACMAFDAARGVCVLFGGGVGYTLTPILADTWEWNGSTWTARTPATVPPPRWGACLVADPVRTEIVLHGGHFGAALGTPSDTWIWDGTDWQQRLPRNVPPGRLSPGGAFDTQDEVVVTFGGQESLVGTTFHDATWVWDGVDWHQDQRSPRPSAQMTFALAYDQAHDRMVKFGGYWTAVEQTHWEYDVGARSTWAAIGSGCGGSVGVPSLRPAGPSRPVVGGTFILEVGHGASNGLAVVAIGVSDQVWIGGSLPLDLAGLGMNGCLLRVSTETLTAVGLVGGAGSLALPIPASPAVIGFAFFAQAMVLDAAANPFGAVLSDASRGVVGIW